MSVLVVDNRERQVIDELGQRGIAHIVDRLDIGDFQIREGAESGRVISVWERKTYGDLAASLSDKRYREQKHRLKTLDAPYKGYILEGKCPTAKFHGLAPGTVDSIRLGLMCRDGFHVIASNSVSHTATILTKILKKTPEYMAEVQQRKDAGGTDLLVDKYHCALVQSSVSTVKKENLTPELCYLGQLCQLPQISYQSAKAIAGSYPNMGALMRLLDDRDTAVLTLSNIKSGDQNGGRRLGVSVAEKIVKYMAGEPQPVKKKIMITKK